MLYLYVGGVRCGKTLSISGEAKLFYEAGYTIYSNIKLKCPYIELKRQDVLNWEKDNLEVPPKTVYIIDELSAWFDSRNSQNSNNKIFSYFIAQLGKFTEDVSQGLTVLASTQMTEFIDIRGRLLIRDKIICKKIKEDKINKTVDILQIRKRNYNGNYKTISKRIIRFNKDDFDFYDTQGKVFSFAIPPDDTNKIIKLKKLTNDKTI